MVKAKTAKTPTVKTLTEKCKKGFFKEHGYIALSFIVPFVLMSIAFAFADIAPFGILRTAVEHFLFQLDGIFPGLGISIVPDISESKWGSNNMLVVDLWHQYFPFINDLHDKLQSGGSLFWTWAVGMGVNFIAMMSYYLLSPLNFLSVLVPSDMLVSYVAVATVIKIALAGMFTAICFKIIFKKNNLGLVICAVMFSLCSFNMGYYWNIIWMDSMAMLPLVVAGTVALLRDGKYKLFIISLALSVIFNYYIGLFICVAVFFTAIGYTAACWQSLRKAVKDLLRTIICAGISLMLTAFITIPSYLALQNCYKSADRMPKGFDINIGADTTAGIIDALHKTFSNALSFISPTSKEGLPNISCGLLCLVLLGIFFCSKKIKKGEKIFCVSSLLFFVISFIFRRLDFMWHGFHYPNMLPYRFSFLYCFLIIYMAYRAFLLLKDSTYIDVIISALVFSMFILLYFMRQNIEVKEGQTNYSTFNENIAIAAIVIGAFMLVAILLYTLNIIPKRFLSLFLCFIVIGEMGASAVIGVKEVGSYPIYTTSNSVKIKNYPSNEKDVDILLSYIDKWTEDENPDIFRVEKTNKYSLNDGALYGFDGVSMFNSMTNVSITTFLDNMGCSGWLAGNRYTYFDSSPVTNVLLNIRYLISLSGKSLCGDPFVELKESSGNNAILYENTKYINMGFLANPELENFLIPVNNSRTNQSNAAEDAFVNPFENQINFWKLATGIDKPLYTKLEVSETNHSVTTSSGYLDGLEIAYLKNASETLSYSFKADKEGYAYSYFYVSGADGKGNILVNSKNVNSVAIDYPYIAPVGKVNVDDQISFDAKFDTNSWVRACCYILNEEVFEEGLRILSESTINATEVTDTKLIGTIKANRDGIIYTSIPYEKGWRVKVDGVEQDMIPLGVIVPDSKDKENPDKYTYGGMCAIKVTKGEHNIEIFYVPDGFTAGALISLVGLFALLFIVIISCKKLRNKKIAKPVTWLFDPAVKEKEVIEDFDFFNENISEIITEDVIDDSVENIIEPDDFSNTDTFIPEASEKTDFSEE